MIHINAKQMTAGGTTLKEGDTISLNGSKGNVYAGAVPTVDAGENPALFEFLKLCDKIRKLKVRTNADTPADAAVARKFGAEGIGLFRTEHMFYGAGSDEPLFYLRKMIVSKTVEERKAALEQLYPFMKRDLFGTFEAMDGYPVTVRLLDPPLHEFVPQSEEKRAELAKALGISGEEFNQRADALHESNPMMGHRGVRLGVTYPEVAEAQIRAILEAAAELAKLGKKVLPEIMIPVTCCEKELDEMKAICERVYGEVKSKYGLKRLDYLFGTMIEIPRACLMANKMAQPAQFFSFGTNDLTQMGFGFSRDDIGGFAPDYLKKGILPADPFNILDQEGIGQLIEMAIERGRSVRPDLKVGICGEHGGEESSVKFCHRVGMNYVSCSPFRVPIARLALAQAVAEENAKKSAKPAKKAVKKATKKVAKKSKR